MRKFTMTFMIIAMLACAAMTADVHAAGHGETTYLTLELTAMGDYTGHAVQARAINRTTLREDAREKLEAIEAAEFSITLNKLMLEGDYWIDIFVDMNDNGLYDGIETDAAWRIEVNSLEEKIELPVASSIEMSDVDWNHLLTLNMSGMTPHLGQQLEFRLVDVRSNERVADARIDTLEAAEATVTLPGMDVGGDYAVEFYADLNGSGTYEGIPTDHAWRRVVENVQGDVTVDFAHSTEFTDIDWHYRYTLHLMDMGPVVGSSFVLRLLDKGTGQEVGRALAEPIADSRFTVYVDGLQYGHSYRAEFFADVNGNNLYDDPPADAAWTLDLPAMSDIEDDVNMTFLYHDEFASLDWNYLASISMSGMAEYTGLPLHVRIVEENEDAEWQIEAGRREVNPIPSSEFHVPVAGLAPGNDYRVDLFVDMNENGEYDAPPVDHAWRFMIENVQADTDVSFAPDDEYTDIVWEYLLTLHLQEVDTYMEKMFEVMLISEDGEYIAHKKVMSIPSDEFAVRLPGLVPGMTYHVDFFIDVNDSGDYTSPPKDFAWSIPIEAVENDVTIEFVPHTNYTDIGFPRLLSVEDDAAVMPEPIELDQNRPNPFNAGTMISFETGNPGIVTLNIYNSAGQKVKTLVSGRLDAGRHDVFWNGESDTGSALSSGVYFYSVRTGAHHETGRMILLK